MRSNLVTRFRVEGSGQKLFFVLVLFLSSLAMNAQCAMCRAALEGDANKGKAEAINDGIVYLMIIPYLLVGIIGYYIYKTGKNLKNRKG
ncbi:MAG: hypothetical protein EOO48_04680 [Flavobacterium sp.]|nr:MAG: hypothetical protein EOO48_04680 [Flavobacterium sp.]